MDHSRTRALLLAVAGCALGLLFCFHRVLFSGFELVQSGIGDGRIENFVLEHGWLWLTGVPGHAEFWNPPILYPLQNVSAHLDIFLSSAPPYWLWRELGLGPHESFQAWTMSVFSLNYLAFRWFLRSSVCLSATASTVGAFFFAFGSARMNHLSHVQLLPQFYAVFVLVALVAAFSSGKRWARIAIVCMGVSLALQAWTAMYLFFFLAIALVCGTLVALADRRLRQPFIASLKRDHLVWALTLVLGAVLLWPLATHYLGTAGELGYPEYTTRNVPRIASWFLMGKTNIAYGWLQTGGAFADLGRPPHSNGVGFLTFLIAAIGLWRYRQSLLVRACVLTLGCIVLLTLLWPGGFTLWEWAREVLPGAKSVRAVGRIGTLLPFVMGLGLAFFVKSTRLHPVILTLLLSACVVEQLHEPAPLWDHHALKRHISRLAARIDPSCDAFHLALVGRRDSMQINEDAMWVAIASGVPTVNGRTGHAIAAHDKISPAIIRSGDEQRLARSLADWLSTHASSESVVCKIRISAEEHDAAMAEVSRGGVISRVRHPRRAVAPQ